MCVKSTFLCGREENPETHSADCRLSVIAVLLLTFAVCFTSCCKTVSNGQHHVIGPTSSVHEILDVPHYLAERSEHSLALQICGAHITVLERRTGTKRRPIVQHATSPVHSLRSSSRQSSHHPIIPFFPCILHSHALPPSTSNAISMMRRSLIILLRLLKPILLHGRSALLSRLALDLRHLILVGLQIVLQVRFLGRCGRGRGLELLDVGVGVVRLDGLRLVGFQLFEVEVLDEVGWIKTFS